ncbi:tripartite motif-containing protein 2-like [Saccostrea cucullata]|uniref:tripartite motif-containing protein 2-like n=1 Tax=Saccostrea cuccullata TaxID=36930 RepID=UPI002ED348C7
MDPKSAQDVIRCDLCDTDIATKYCDFCHVNLCISCIGKHISDDYDKHKVVPFQKRKSTLIYPKCTTHQTKKCKFHCKDCNISVCSICTAMSDTHKGHNFSALLDIYNEKRKVIAKDTEELKNILSPTYDEIKSDLENQIANLDGEYEKLIKAMLKQGEEWHRQIKIFMDKIKAEIEDIKLKHMSILKEHLDEIKSIQNLIEETQIKLSEIEESTEVSKTTEYSSKNKEFCKLPPKVQVSLPLFIPNTIDIEQLYKLIGSLLPLSSTKDENGYRLKEAGTLSKELMKVPELISMVKTGYQQFRNVTCNSEEEIWTNARDTSNMKCFNIQGSIIKTIKTISNEWPNDITINKDGNLVYCDWKTKTVNEVKYGQSNELIRLKGWTPLNLCVSSSGDILVVMFNDDETESKVVRYSGSTEKQTIQFENESKPLYSGKNRIKYITENRNLDICLSDWEACAVVVVSDTGNLRFRYTGHPSSSKNKPFRPYGIATDSQSHILTADFDNHCIHVLDEDGKFINYIDNAELENPYGICVDKNDYLFVAEYHTGNVKKIKYLE